MLSVKDIIDHLSAQGYTANLLVKDGHLFSDHTELNLSKSQIDGTYRVESDSDPTHQSIIYSITCSDPPIKGVVVNSHGRLGDKEKHDLIEKLESTF